MDFLPLLPAVLLVNIRFSPPVRGIEPKKTIFFSSPFSFWFLMSIFFFSPLSLALAMRSFYAPRACLSNLIFRPHFLSLPDVGFPWIVTKGRILMLLLFSLIFCRPFDILAAAKRAPLFQHVHDFSPPNLNWTSPLPPNPFSSAKP